MALISRVLDDVFKLDPDNAFVVLGIPPDASREDARAAYLEQIRKHPQESDPEGFQRVKEAWRVFRDPLARASDALESIDPDRTLPEMVAPDPGARLFTGPKPWQAVITTDE